MSAGLARPEPRPPRTDSRADTPWRAGRLDARGGARAILFGRVYEDSSIESAAFRPGGRVFCIASAGCTALALCREREVVACDINPAQIAYVRRRIAGGPSELGKVDKLLSGLRRLMPLIGWSAARIARFLDMQDPELQLVFWREVLDGWRFRRGLGLLLAPLALRAVYDPARLASLPTHFERVLRARMQRCFARHPNRTNPYAHLLLRGMLDPAGAPAVTRAEAGGIQLVTGDAATYLESCPCGSFDGFSLSNILDGAGAAYAARLSSAVRHAASADAIAIRRSFGEPDGEPDGAHLGGDTNQAERDRSMLWGLVDVRPARELVD